MSLQVPQMGRLWLLAFALLCSCGPSQADVNRPLDERATVRLIVDEVARQQPDAVIARSGRHNWIVLHLPDGRKLQLLVAPIHEALRASGTGTERQILLRDFVAKQLLAIQAVSSPAEEQKFDLSRAMPVLRPFVPPPPPQTLFDYLAAMLAPVGRPFQNGVIQCWTIEALPAGFDCFSAISLNGMAEDDLAQMALVNAQNRADKAFSTMSGPFHKVSLDPKFASSLMFLDEYWDSRAQGKRLIASIPTANELIWIAGASDTEIAVLRQRTSAAYAAGKVARFGPTQEKVIEAVSPDLYLWTGGGWAVLAPTPRPPSPPPALP